MSSKVQGDTVSRRGFLKSAAVVGGAASVAALGSQAQASVIEKPELDKAATSSRGYHESPHIREYYEKARF